MHYAPPPHVTQNWTVTKPAASGRRGIVASQSRDAAEVGIAVLEAGGNAIDAAVAVGLALPTVEPWNSGLGGIGFAVVHRAGERRAEVVDFGPVAPRGLNPGLFKLTGGRRDELFSWPEVVGDANIHGPLSVAIPSTVAGYRLMHERWGKMPLADIITPAIALAERGLARDWFTTVKIAGVAATLAKYAESARIYLPGGFPPVGPDQGNPGYFRLGNLAATLGRLREAGLRDFYEGDIAASIVSDLAAMGGVLSAADLRGCQARVVPAMEIGWHGRVLQLATGLTAAPTLAAVLNRMAEVPTAGRPDAAWYAALAGSLKAAYAERLSGLGDAEPMAAETCTTHFTVCDEAGTMVAVTSTLLSTMGSRVVLPQSGVLLNNGIMWFDPRPGQANSIAPGKRPLTNMCPIVLASEDRPILAAGASGGRRIMAAVFQMMAYVADFGMDPQAAAHHPRIDVSGPDNITADMRLGAEIIAALRDLGPVEVVEHRTAPANFACPNLILQRDDGTREGISDVMSPWSAALAQPA
jgi:gamma-glutamyltranspeptidase/glutathione hydrolase